MQHRDSSDDGRIRLAYVSTYDSQDIRSWSGIPASMASGFASLGADVRFIGPLREHGELRGRLKARIARRFGRTRLRDRERTACLGWARQVDAALAAQDADFVIATGAVAIAYSRSPAPTAIWADATFAAMVDFYPDFARLSRASLRAGLELDRMAMNRAALVMFASRWAADSAIRDYGIPSEKVHVIPFGANLPAPPSEDVRAAIDQRAGSVKLLWLGADWDRKRGAFAIDVANHLNALGLPAEIVLAGQRPPPGDRLPAFARHEGWIDKSTAAGQEKLATLLRQSHFLVLPTTAEAFGIVFAEASAFGVPSVATDVGGVSDAVIDRENGLLLSADATPADFAAAMAEFLRSPGRYTVLANSSRSCFEDRLNWDHACGHALELMRDVLHG